jgi:DNA-binding winged helix-turn-helix (wHTH) protein/Tol biopolymer transport system component
MNTEATIFEFGNFRFDTARQELRRRGRRVRISVSLLKLLTLFLSRPGELVTRGQIADTLWQIQGTIDVAVGINTTVRRLRAILEDDPSSPLYIETVIGLGYRFIAAVEEVEAVEDTAPRSPPDEVEREIPATADIVETDTKEIPQTFAGRRLAVRFIGGAALLIAGLGITSIRHHQFALAGEKPARTVIPAPTEISFNNEDNPVTAEVISSDGHLLAYSDRLGISLHSLDDGTEQLLTSLPALLPERLSWHAGENSLVVSGVDRTSHRSMVWSVFQHGVPPQILFSDASMAMVSPDGSAIAYTQANNTELWVSDGRGKNSRLLVPNVDGQHFVSLLWSPMNNRLVFDRVITTGEYRTAKSSKATKSDAIHEENYESVDASTGGLLSIQPNIHFDSGILLKDGRFLFADNGAPGGARLMMAQTDPDTGRFLSSPQPVPQALAWNVSRDTVAAESLSASSNGEVLGAVLTRATIDTYWANIHLPGPMLRGETRLTGELGANYPQAWSPDGNAVVFDGDDGASLIGRQRLGEAKLEILARLPKTSAMANFSPDGKWILFTEYDGTPGHAVAIFSIPAAGGDPRQLPTTGTLDEFHCSNSFTGSCVMRENVGKREFVFYALDPVKGMGQELGRVNWKPTVIGDWSLSPDGSTVAMADHDPDHPAIELISLSPHGSSPISAIPVHGFGVVREPTWAADGKGFYVETKTASTYALLYVDRAGRVTLLRQSPNSIWGISSRDGKKLTFPGRTLRSNAWVGHTALAR